MCQYYSQKLSELGIGSAETTDACMCVLVGRLVGCTCIVVNHSMCQNGWTALTTAAYFCQLKVVEVLISNNCSVALCNKVRLLSIGVTCCEFFHLCHK